MKKRILFLLFLPLFFTACSSDADELEPKDLVAKSTYAEDVKAIIDNNCLGCHDSPPTNGAPMKLTTAVSVKEAVLDRGLIERVEEGSMPPSGSLTTVQIKVLTDWELGGFK